jgi:hypothetical protein
MAVLLVGEAEHPHLASVWKTGRGSGVLRL